MTAIPLSFKPKIKTKQFIICILSKLFGSFYNLHDCASFNIRNI